MLAFFGCNLKQRLQHFHCNESSTFRQSFLFHSLFSPSLSRVSLFWPSLFLLSERSPMVSVNKSTTVHTATGTVATAARPPTSKARSTRPETTATRTTILGVSIPTLGRTSRLMAPVGRIACRSSVLFVCNQVWVIPGDVCCDIILLGFSRKPVFYSII